MRYEDEPKISTWTFIKNCFAVGNMDKDIDKPDQKPMLAFRWITRGFIGIMALVGYGIGNISPSNVVEKNVTQGVIVADSAFVNDSDQSGRDVGKENIIAVEVRPDKRLAVFRYVNPEPKYTTKYGDPIGPEKRLKEVSVVSPEQGLELAKARAAHHASRANQFQADQAALRDSALKDSYSVSSATYRVEGPVSLSESFQQETGITWKFVNNNVPVGVQTIRGLPDNIAFEQRQAELWSGCVTRLQVQCFNNQNADLGPVLLPIPFAERMRDAEFKKGLVGASLFGGLAVGMMMCLGGLTAKNSNIKPAGTTPDPKPIIVSAFINERGARA